MPTEDEYEELLRALGKRVRELRKSRGLLLKDMTIRYGYADSQWRKIERGGGGLNLLSLMKIAEAFGIGIDELFRDLTDFPHTAAAVKSVAKKNGKNNAKPTGNPPKQALGRRPTKPNSD